MRCPLRYEVILGKLVEAPPAGWYAEKAQDDQRGFPMNLMIENDPVPLRADNDEVIRVGGTRVTLDTVVAAFEEGATAEEIAQQYPSLALSDVYAVIAFYLRRKAQVDEYLRQRQELAAATRKDNEARHDPLGVRERLLARRPRDSSTECCG